jgi:glycosyltransferase involved in cell wall biosynthesis
MSTDDRPAATPTVYYLSPDPAGPYGGVRVIYRHVDELNAIGFSAAVVHHAPGFRCAWFDNDTRVTSAGKVVLHPNDVLVVSGFYGPGLDRLPTGPSVVIFNQGAYYTFEGIRYDSVGPGAPYVAVPGLVGILSVSQDNVNLLRYTFPTIPVYLTRQVIDPSVFHPGSASGRRIAFMTSRRPQERDMLLHMLRSRGVLEGWELCSIEGRSEREAANILRSCPIFLSFSEREGFGLPPAEAMACGAYVVGYTGMGGRDFFDPAYCSPVPDGDILTFAQAVESAIQRYEQQPESVTTTGRMASQHVLSRYTVENLRQDLLDVFKAVTSGES